MSLIFSEDFTGTDGVYMTTGNSTFDSVDTNSGFYGFIFDNGGYSGTGVRETTDGGQANVYIPDIGGGTYAPGLAKAKLEVKFYMDTNFPTVERGLVTLLGTMDWVYSYIQTDGKIRLENQFSTSSDLSAVLPVDTWIRASIQFDGLNDINLDIFYGANVEGTTPDETLTLASLQDGVVTYAYIGYKSGGYTADSETVIYDAFELYNNILPPVYVDFSVTDTIPAITDEISGLAQGGPSGRLDDFGLWIEGDNDAAITRVVAYDVGDNADWVRTSTTATRPRDYFLSRGSGPVEDELLWRRAEYGVASPKWDSVVADEANLLDAIQFEKQGPARNLLSGNAANFEKELVYGDYWSSGFRTASVTRNNDEVTPYNGEWVLKVTGDVTSGVSTYHPVPEDGMARVEEGVYYTGALRIKSGTQTVPWFNEFDVQIRYYDSDFIEVGASTTVFWAIPDSSWYRFYRTAVAPAGAVWAAVVAVCQAGKFVQGDTWYVDDVRLSRYSDPTPTDWDEARRVIVNLRADSVNYVKNPGPYYDEFGYGWMRGWFDEGDGGVTYSSNVEQSVFLYGDNSYRQDVTSTGTGTAGVRSEDVQYEGPESAMISGLLPNTPYVASAWVLRDSNADVSCAVRHNGETEVAGFPLSTVLAENLYDENYVQMDGDGNQWVRVYCPFILESDTLAGGSQIVFAVYLDGDLVSGDSLLINAMQVQEGSVPTEYFDGSLYSSETPDYLWEENTLGSTVTPFWARSHWYFGRRAKVSRVYDVVENNLPKDTPYTIRFAQPAKERRILRDVYGNPLS